MTRHLIFDFFGTLVGYSPSRTAQGYHDAHAFYREAGGRLDYAVFMDCWSSAFSELDTATATTLREYSMVETTLAFRDRAEFSASAEVLAELTARYLREWNKGVETIDGVAPMLERLATRFDLSIITNTHDPDLVPGHLREMGVLELFSQIVTSVSFGHRKPDARIFEHSLRGLSARARECIYVGDSHVPDFEGPRAVGIRALLVDPRGESPVPEEHRVESILALESVLVDASAAARGS